MKVLFLLPYEGNVHLLHEWTKSAIQERGTIFFYVAYVDKHMI